MFQHKNHKYHTQYSGVGEKYYKVHSKNNCDRKDEKEGNLASENLSIKSYFTAAVHHYQARPFKYFTECKYFIYETVFI